MEPTIYDPETFPVELLTAAGVQKRGRGNPRSRQRREYVNMLTAFDIETTRLPEIEQSVMYVWQWAFTPAAVVMGRTWDQFLAFLDRIGSAVAGLGEDVSLVVWVHNLSFEFQFLRGVLEFATEDVFCIRARKILRARWKFLEFRCSYLHSNMSLSEFAEKFNAEHGKLSGTEFDYEKLRFPWTPLSERERAYCINDVVGLVEALGNEMEHDGDSLYTVPLTSTGYVRRDVKNAMREVSHTYLGSQLPGLELFYELREAFRGGDTHANRYLVGDTLHNVHSADRSSSYPDIVCNCLFPVSAFFQQPGKMLWEEMEKLIFVRDKAVLCRMRAWGLRLRDPFFPAPYLSRDKCKIGPDAEIDNGRILEASFLETCVTDVDLRIIAREYRWEAVEFFDVAYARYGPLPEALRREAISYYRTKTELKGDAAQEIFYTKAKNKLNSIYGMMAQNPLKRRMEYHQEMIMDRWGYPTLYAEDEQETDQEILERAYRRAFLVYQWGVWVTAWARYRLREGIWLTLEQGGEFVYCDTDSVKYLGTVDWSAFNRQRIKDSTASGAWADDSKGARHYMGVFEPEHDMPEFRTLGAKKYVYTDERGKIHCTVAGVGKSAGGRELEAAGGIDQFRPGFTFSAAGGVEAVYNDAPELQYPDGVEIEGHRLRITSNVSLRPSTYTLGLAADYERLLRFRRYTIDNYEILDV